MTIGVYVLDDDHQQDHLALDATESVDVYLESTGTGFYDYNESTALFEAGTDYNQSSQDIVFNKSDEVNYEVEAVMKTAELLSPENLDMEYSAMALHLKTGICNNSMEIRQYLDMNSIEPSDYDQINFYNDAYEINSGATVARVGGSRNAILHKDIPIRSAHGSGTSIQINVSSEGEINEFRLKLEDVSAGGQI